MAEITNIKSGLGSIVTLAAEAVTDRRGAYGSPYDNFNRIAELHDAWLSARYDGINDFTIDTLDVAAMMILTKLARLINMPEHKDSWVDIAGYADAGYQAVIQELARERANNSDREN